MNNMNSDFYEFEGKEELAQQLAENVADNLQIALSIKGKAMLAVSGGSTPISFFKALAKQSLDFNKITLIMVDERWVATDDKDSSERLLHEAFAGVNVEIFSLAPQQGENVHDGAARLDTELKAIDFAPDITILGMGDDGHTASLFPNHETIAEALDPSNENMIIAITNSPKPPNERVSLTYSAIIRSQKIILHITGKAKLDKFKKAAQSLNVNALPISAFINQNEKSFCVYYAN